MAISGIGDALERAASGPARKLADEPPKKVPAKPTRRLTDEHEIAKARKACQDFEAIFIHKMLSSMRAAFESDKGDDKDFGGDMFKSMMDEQLGIALARAGGIGLARMLGSSLGIEDEFQPAGSGPPRDFPAEVRIMAYERAKAGPGLEAYEPAIKAAASDSGVSENLIKAVILQESGGDARAVSGKGAKGLMQLMDATAEELGVRNSFNPAENIRGGARYLAGLLKEFKGDLELALASYNAGIGTVRKFGGIPPYKETQNYVKKVMAKLDKLNAASGG
jgi:Rod binding domain-containing protein